MKTSKLMKNILPYILGLSMLLSCANSNGKKTETTAPSARPEVIKEYALEIVAEYPHDVTSYTQGLFFHEGQMYESTGRNGESTFRMVDLETGKALKRQNFDDKYFVEGSVILGDNLYILTWESQIAFIYDARTLKFKSARRYPREGWGLTTDGENLIASDGSSYLYFMDGEFNVKRKLQVKVNSRAVRWLNELEYIDGMIWANIYTTDEIAIINPKTGYVEGVIDCTGLLPQKLRKPETDVLNGIALNPLDGKIYLTGKNWPKLYEIKLVEKR